MGKILGLSENQVEELRKEYGQNLILEKEEVSWPAIFFSQFKSPLIYILLFVAFVSVLLKEYIDATLTVTVLFVNVLMGFYQEYNAQKVLSALNRLIKPKAWVIRDGQRKEIEAKELVPADIVIIAAGDKIPADGQLIKGAHLLVNEAILTGEEEAVAKTKDSPLFMGTIVLSGRGLMVVSKIGQTTEIGKISQSLSQIKEPKTPLQLKLEVFIKKLAWLVLGICLVIFLIGVVEQEKIWEMLRVTLVLAVAAIPEGLPIAITVILALGMRRILKKHGLVKKLLAIETLGSTSVICTDKTGTLTEGKMQVIKTDFKNEKEARMALVLDNNQTTNLEVALWDYVRRVSGADPQELFDQYERIEEEPFDSEKKYSQSINRISQKNIAFLLGAPEVVLSFCALGAGEKEKVNRKIAEWASEGLRLLAVALKKEGNLMEKKDYQWLGLVAINDPIRPEAKQAIQVAQKAGIKIKIITGDYRQTAERIAANLGFKLTMENIMEGQELESISEEELKSRIENIVLFTRVSPHQKLKIVRALQEKGEVVAMTGDGVNDAPALKQSDIGVVVGNASDVAKETGDLILLDSNFKTMVDTLEEGRLIFANLKKVVGYVLSNSFVEIILIFGAIVLNFSAPLTVVQILWINLICDGPPDIVLGFEAKEKGLMEKSPKSLREEEILSGPVKFSIVAVSITTGLLSLFLFLYFLRQSGNLDLARTIAFAAVSSVSLIYIFAFKSLEKSLLKTNLWANKYLLAAVGYGFGLLFIAIYVPFFNRVLKTVPLGLTHWLLVLGVGIVATLIVEVVKYLTTPHSVPGTEKITG